MAFGNSPAGTITKQATGIASIRRIGLNGGANVSKGNVVFFPVDGFATVASSADVGHFGVALQAGVSVTDGDVSIPVAVKGHYVTVIASAAISPGERVKVSTTVAGQVAAMVEGTDAEGKLVGVYWGKEGGKVVKSTTSADGYQETFTDSADFVPVDCAANDVIEVELK